MKSKTAKKILIINIDSTIPNLALKKIEKYHQDLGDEVVWNVPSFRSVVDKIYVSCIFDYNKDKCKEWEGIAEIGGSGYDILKKLPEEIENIKPKINLGFTTRGCIRKCYFCIVSKKEGNIYPVGDIYDIWDKKSKELMILDNNILALPDHFEKIAYQILQENLRVDFNQGLDHRLLTPNVCRILLSLHHIAEIRFAYDDISNHPTVQRGLQMLKEAGLKKWKTRWYVYIGEKDTFDTVMQRIDFLRNEQQNVFIMRDRKIYNKKAYIALACWANGSVGAFKIFSFWDWLVTSPRMKQYIPYFDLKLKQPKIIECQN
jgi:hypothetical protein